MFCMVMSNASLLMVIFDSPVNRQKHTIENITFPQFCWQAVNMVIFKRMVMVTSGRCSHETRGQTSDCWL